MPPKIKYTRDEVIGAALSVVEEIGLNSLTARNVAFKLDSSTAPVYNHFATMDEFAVVMAETQTVLNSSPDLTPSGSSEYGNRRRYVCPRAPPALQGPYDGRGQL